MSPGLIITLFRSECGKCILSLCTQTEKNQFIQSVDTSVQTALLAYKFAPILEVRYWVLNIDEMSSRSCNSFTKCSNYNSQ